MNDSGPVLELRLEPLPDEPLPREEARKKFIDALTALASAMMALEASAWRDGWNKNSEWTKIQLKKFAEKAAQEAADMAFTTVDGRTVAVEVKAMGSGRVSAAGRTAADIVYTFIKDNPGKTGVEIVRGLEDSGLEIHERTVRTALFRLKRDKIAAVENRWYTTEKAREVAQARHERKEKELI
jgi:hypothetical protein